MIRRLIKFIELFLPPALLIWINHLQSKRRRYFGLEEIDKKIEQYLNFDSGFFVELGANNGIEQSNTLYFEKFRNWKGVLVEPTPHNFLLCRQNRSNLTKIFCNACTSFDYKEKFVEIAFSNLMSTPLGLESDIDQPELHAKSGLQFLGKGVPLFNFGSPARSLNSILLESNAPTHIDLLSLDVEGAEIEVLKGIDHNQFRFRFVCVETRDIEKMKLYMQKNGYRFVDRLSSRDCLFESTKLFH